MDLEEIESKKLKKENEKIRDTIQIKIEELIENEIEQERLRCY